MKIEILRQNLRLNDLLKGMWVFLQCGDHVLSMTAKEINHVNANNQEPG